VILIDVIQDERVNWLKEIDSGKFKEGATYQEAPSSYKH